MMTPRDREKDHVSAGWNDDHDLRWIEIGRLRLEEDEEGAHAVIHAPAEASTWLSATELAGLARHLAGWFTDDPSEAIRQIETCATFVKIELDGWNDRARIDEEHPPYDDLTRALDALLATCRHLREVGLLAEHPKKSARPEDRSYDEVDGVVLRDADAKKHPAYQAFRRQLRGRVYGDVRLNDAWTAFKHGWDSRGGDV